MTKAIDNEDLFSAGKELPVMEEFYSLQGEGAHTGKPAYFIRLGGCDIGCSWCDVKRSWAAHLHPLLPISKLITNALACPARALLVTGGEPSTYNLTPLTDQFRAKGFELFLETAGTYKLTGNWDWVCLSPKRQHPPREEYYERADELKVIVETTEDLDWAERNLLKVHSACLTYLQPEWSSRKEMGPLIVEYIKEHPIWRLSMQSHKYLGIP